MLIHLTEVEQSAIDAFKKSLIRYLPDQIESIIIFGSKARGEIKPFSDIDLLVVVNDENLELWDKIQTLSSEISLEYDVLLSVKIMDLSHLEFLRRVQSGLIKNIDKEGTIIWKAA